MVGSNGESGELAKEMIQSSDGAPPIVKVKTQKERMNINTTVMINFS